MRAGLSTIQQTLTPEASAVLNQSIAEAGRRNHGQTTPLHVAATLLASPSGYLRQACIRSHPNSSHPLQCRALELCFSVALERLPTTQNMAAPTAEPPISNALMAALKRAQAHQRRGCPEQQQQPLLAVKVELEQLIISILDDPSVSRVMREASFSSPAVKATIEQSLNNSNAQPHQHHLVGGNVGFVGIGPRVLSSPPLAPLASRNIYLNPRLQPGAAAGLMRNQKDEDVKKVLEIMGRSTKKNPVLVGDSEPGSVVKELLRKIANKELDKDVISQNLLQVMSLVEGLPSDSNQMATKIEQLRGLIETKIKDGGVILDLGDLKWLVEHPPGVQLQQPKHVVSETGKAAVAEITKLFRISSGGDGNKLWLIGTATCETYLRCQVYHPTMETDWDLQAVPIASRSPLHGTFPRFGTEKMPSSPPESLNSFKSSSPRIPSQTRLVSENMDPAQRSNLCPQCTDKYEKELAKLTAIEKSFSESVQQALRPILPPWLQSAATFDSNSKDETRGKEQDLLPKQKTQELQRKWRDICLHLHADFHQNARLDKISPPSLSTMGLCSPNLLPRPPFQLKLQGNKPIGEALQLNMNQMVSQLANRRNSPPGSPVRTELALGRNNSASIIREKHSEEDHTTDFLGCIVSKPQMDKLGSASDADAYKKLLKDLMEKAWWQPQAVSAVASAITRFRLGEGKRQGGGTRGDVWFLFTGPERVGKRKMAAVISEQVCGGRPIMICLGKRREEEENETCFRGKTAIDRIAEAVHRNPFSVIMLEDMDEADMLVRGSIKRAMERGRLTDSHGREVGLGNAIVIVTGDWSTLDSEAMRDGHFVDEKRLATVAGGSWQLGLIVRDKGAKRRTSWVLEEEEERPMKPPRKDTATGMSSISLDLNLAAGSCGDDERTDGSFNSSDVTTIDQDDEHPELLPHFSITSLPQELVCGVEETILFKPVEFSFVRREMRRRISMKFSSIVDEKVSIEIGDDVLEKILGGVWHDRTSLDEWIKEVVEPSFEQLRVQLPPAGEGSNTVVRLVVESDSCNRGKSKGDVADCCWLPKSILV